MPMLKSNCAGLLLASCLAATAPALAVESPRAAPVGAEQIFAVVNGSVISVPRYDAELNLLIREKFYHRRPAENQMGPLRRETGDRLIERVLLLAECARRGLGADATKVGEALAAIETRNKANPVWTQRREELLPEVKLELEQNSMLERLEAAVRKAPEPSEDELRAYFAQHMDKFTEPDQLHLSVILLRVDPGSPQAEWDKAKTEARSLRERIVAGADFAALAREYSKDASAQKGGDLGYIHRGMLPDELHAIIDKLARGAISEPLQMLEGIALYRVEERIAAQPKTFEESRQRAAQLWQRDWGGRQWNALKAALRQSAKIEIRDPARYPQIESAKP